MLCSGITHGLSRGQMFGFPKDTVAKICPNEELARNDIRLRLGVSEATLSFLRLYPRLYL